MLEIDLEGPTPLTEQIVAGIRTAIAAEVVSPGDELPPVRQLAADLGINFNTVARAYRVLESSGLVSSKRGRGTRVVAGVEPAAVRDRERVLFALHSALVEARLGGWSREDVWATLQQQFEHLWARRSAETSR